MQPQFRFQPIAFSWVALHPDPKGVIQFMGGAFFGSFPTLFYRYFLRQIYEAGYTIVALPFRFTFRHWSVAIALLEEQRVLRSALIDIAKRSGYAYEVYERSESYSWIGHSVGCKYIALLELLSDNSWQENTIACFESGRAKQTLQQINESPVDGGICGQRSLLMAPDISDTDSAIPKPIARIVDALGLGVQPNRRQTLCLIEQSHLFNLTAMISFHQDSIAGNIQAQDETKSDVVWLVRHLSDRDLPFVELPGKHLEPIGIRIGNSIVDLNPLDKFIVPLSRRKLESTVLMLLEKLKQR
ncbi:MAG: DUF1350 family protein [Cyanobacteria bacterium CRU_2_1]|nr:DUF1350 family protein [Cyanobacteria bacterium RU_5_0]NJR58593.1 DUF1350 family protein [Cyanobacteria bacterium CRU_2_1]